jgi:hypothetical protein
MLLVCFVSMLMAADILLYDAEFVPVGKTNCNIKLPVMSPSNHQMGDFVLKPKFRKTACLFLGQMGKE